jgi:hypothetical protein
MIAGRAVTGSDGRRWWLDGDSGRAVELKAVEPPKKPKRKIPR